MSNVKKITSVFATLFCMGTSTMAKAEAHSRDRKSASLTSNGADQTKEKTSSLATNMNSDQMNNAISRTNHSKQTTDEKMATTTLKSNNDMNNKEGGKSVITNLDCDDAAKDRTRTETKEPSASTEPTALSTKTPPKINNEKSTKEKCFALQSPSGQIRKTIIKSYPFGESEKYNERTFLFNFRDTKTRPTDHLPEGAKIYYNNDPDFKGLVNCGIPKKQAELFYNEVQVCVSLESEAWKEEYGKNEEWSEKEDKKNEKLTNLIEMVKEQALAYYKHNKHVNADISKISNYSNSLGKGIDKLIKILENSNWSDEDKKEIDDSIREYNRNPKMKLLRYNKSDVFPLRNVIIKLGEAKIIHLYTKLFLKVIDEIENTDNLLNDDLYQSPSDGEAEKDKDVIKDKIMEFILDKNSAISRKLDVELSKTVLSSDGFFDKFKDYENYKKETSPKRSNRPVINPIN